MKNKFYLMLFFYINYLTKMRIYLIFFILCTCLLNIKSEPLSMNNFYVPEGVYNIILKKKYFSLSFVNNELILSKDKLGADSINYRFRKVTNSRDPKLIYYTIEHIKTKLYLGIKSSNTRIHPLIFSSEIIENKIFSFEFTINKIENNAYAIQNKNGCYLKGENLKIICVNEEPPKLFAHFHLFKIFSEIQKNKNDESILEKEPIDVFIKYKLLNDSNLVREGIHKIKKDNENEDEELKYSIRSILKNIPWVRKIFILMPNKKVRYFKDYYLIKEKIVYIKNKDFLGYDSENLQAFQYRLWKMKDFGMSDNFILMNDDCFIGQPLNKSDFFYVENGKVVPAIISTNYQVHTQKTFLRDYNKIKKRLKTSINRSTNEFLYSMYNAYFFFINYFKGPIIVPYFTHNIISMNVNDLKEIYNIIYDSKYRNTTLDSVYKNVDTLQFQSSVLIYIFNKYNRKVNMINYNYINNEISIKGNYDFPLFFINKENNKNYSKVSFQKTRLIMEKLFPDPTPYETIDYNMIPNLAFDVVKKIEDEIRNLYKNQDKDTEIKLKTENKRKKKYTEKCNTITGKYKRKNKQSLEKALSLENELDTCLTKTNYIKIEIQNLENDKKYYNNSIDYEDIRKDLDKNIEIAKRNIITLNLYESKYNESKKKMEIIQNQENKLSLIAYLELGIIFTFAVLFGIYYFFKEKISFEKEEDLKTNINN